MNARALRVLEAGGSIEVLLADRVELVRSDERHLADLGSTHVRRLVENAAIIVVLAEVGELINDVGYGMLRDDPVLG